MLGLQMPRAISVHHSWSEWVMSSPPAPVTPVAGHAVSRQSSPVSPSRSACAAELPPSQGSPHPVTAPGGAPRPSLSDPMRDNSNGHFSFRDPCGFGSVSCWANSTSPSAQSFFLLFLSTGLLPRTVLK